MKYCVLIGLVIGLFYGGEVFAQGVGPAPGVGLQEEGANVGRVQILNCVGTAVTCTKSGVTGVLTITGGSGYSTVEDEGVALTQRTTINFTGAGVSCVDSGGKTVCTISGGGAGSANVVEVSVPLGTSGGLVFSTTVTGQAWVTATSSIACTPLGLTTDGQTVETVAASGVQPIVSDRVAGTGFNLNVYSPHGATGTYRFGCTGA